jgi:aspartate aminotransferase
LPLQAVARKVALKPPAFDLDLDAIDAAIGPRTRLVIVNTPHNPTGRIYSRETLAKLSQLLEHASTRIGHRIYLLSDEPYRRLRFDGRGFDSPAAIYPWTFIAYSYGKVLLAPGQRLGYLAISPVDAGRGTSGVRRFDACCTNGTGLVLPECCHAVRRYRISRTSRSIEAALARRRDRLMSILGENGVETLPPRGRSICGASGRRQSGAALERIGRPQCLRNARQPPGCARVFSHQSDGV